MSYSPALELRYENIKKLEYQKFVRELGTQTFFENDRWICNNRIRSAAETASDVTIYFSVVPFKYREMMKYFTVIQIISGTSIKTCIGKIQSLITFLNFLDKKTEITELGQCSMTTAVQYKNHLDRLSLEESTKSLKWTALNIFFRVMEGREGINHRNPFTENPYMHYRRRSYKYIPKDICVELDKAFEDETIPVHLRCIYWVLRLIPSRINEVLGMKIECLKPYNGHYCLFIPTWKQNGGYWEPIMRTIHLEDVGTARKLLSLIREQQELARQLQFNMEEDKKDALFTYRKKFWRENGKDDLTNEYKVANKGHVYRYFKKVSERNIITDENGAIYRVTSHQFRHNGITDRLAAGFTPEQIMFMTAHHGDAMIYKAYNHLDLIPEVIVEKQQCLMEQDEKARKYNVLFGGRILNMEEQLEKRLLKNIRAHKVAGGICSDITGCKSDMFHCLECESFIPDTTQLSYFIGQAESWREKAVKFAPFPIIKENALRNAELFERITEKIKEAVNHV
jgi:hypothetical protein